MGRSYFKVDITESLPIYAKVSHLTDRCHPLEIKVMGKDNFDEVRGRNAEVTNNLKNAMFPAEFF